MLLDNKKPFRILIAIFLSLGLILVQATAWSRVYAQITSTPTVTETLFKLSAAGANYCGPDLAKLYLSLQYQVIQETKRVKGAVCGSLVTIEDAKTKKEYLGFNPCNRSDGPYIFNTRPKELMNYYMLVDVKIKKGKMIVSEDFGEVTRYISTFSTYYPIDSCYSCGYLPAPITSPIFIFPTPTATSTHVLLSALQSTGVALAGFNGYVTSDGLDYNKSNSPQVQFKTTMLAQRQTPAPAQIALIPPASSVVHSPSPSATLDPTTIGSRIQAKNPINQTRPPSGQPLGILSYSLYTFLIVPLIILVIILRRERIS